MENTTDHLTGTSTLLRPDVAADHILGSASAPVTIIEYGDFESPSCGRAHVGLKILLGHFGDRVRFVFRHYPEIEIHPHAERAAEAGEAAGAQGRFWPYYDVLFEHREYLSERHLRQYAAQVGVDLERYDNEMNDHLYRQRVQQHAMDGRNLGIRAMPTFFIDGILTDVSFGLRHLEDAVDHELRMIDST